MISLKLGKIAILTSILFISKSSIAETLFIFDNSHLIAATSNQGIVGYFNTEHQILNFSCSFLFKGTGRQAESEIKINSFPIQDKGYRNRNKEDDIPGKVFIRNGEWIIQTEESHAGCGGAVGSFDEGPNDDHPTRYAVIKEMPAIGIRLVLKKSKLLIKDGKSIKERKGFLVNGDVVAAIETQDEFTRIRYVHPASGKITLAWLKSNDLGDPFVEAQISKMTDAKH